MPKNTEHSDSSLEQAGQKQPGGFSEIQNQINNAQFEGAFTNCRNADMSDTEWNNLNGQLDRASLSESEQGAPMSASEFEGAQNSALGGRIDEYGVENNDVMGFISESQGAIQESNEIIDEMLGLIKDARTTADKSRGSHKWGVNVLPLVGSIYGLFKSRRLKKNLTKLEALKDRLDGGRISTNLDADLVSPAKGQGLQTVGWATTLAGGVIAGPIGMLPGMITGLVGRFKEFSSFEETGKTIEDLDKLESDLRETKTQNNQALSGCDKSQAAYRDGAIENLQGLAAA